MKQLYQAIILTKSTTSLKLNLPLLLFEGLQVASVTNHYSTAQRESCPAPLYLATQFNP